MIEISKPECCSNCIYYKTLYVPPLKCYNDVRYVVGGNKNGRVCTALADEGDVMYLGKADENANEGMCELYTERKSK